MAKAHDRRKREGSVRARCPPITPDLNHRPPDPQHYTPAPCLTQLPTAGPLLRVTSAPSRLRFSGTGPWLLALAGAAAGFALVARHAPAPFLFDDTPSVVVNQSIRDPGNLRALLFPATDCPVAGRPLANWSYALNFAWGALDPSGYRLVNAAIHAVSVGLLFAFGSVFLPLGSGGTSGPAGRWCAGSAAALWGVHPLVLGTVVYVSQRTELLMAMFYLLTLLGALRSLEARAHAVGWSLASVASAFAGVLCKEPMVTAPVVVILLDWAVLGDQWRARWRGRIPLYAGLVLSWVPLFWLMSDLQHRSVGFGAGAGVAEYALTQCRALALYAGKFVFPRGLTFDYGPIFLRWGSTDVLWVAVPVLVGVAVLAVGRRHRALGALLLASLLILSPTSSIVPVAAQPIAENRAYLPTALLALAGWPLLVSLCPVVSLARVLPLVTAGAALVLGAVSWNRLALFAEPEAIWRDTIAKAPANPRAFCNLGELQLAAGRLGEAEASFRHALALNQDYNGFAAMNLGITLARAGRLTEAVDFFRLETRLQPGKPVVHDNLGNALTQMGLDAEAIAAFEQALSLDADHLSALNNLAGAHFRAGRFPEAIRLYQRALQREPADARVRRNLGVTLLVAGRYEESVRLLTAPLARPDLDPDSALIGSSALLELGRAAEAESVLLGCLAARAAWPEAKLLLGNARVALGRIAEGIAAYEAALEDRPGWDQAIAALGRARERLRIGTPPAPDKADPRRSASGSQPAGPAPTR